MAIFLTPDKTITLAVGGKTLTVNQKIIPDSLRAEKDVADYVKKGQPMKPCGKLGDGTGKPRGVCVHNTDDIKVAAGTNAAEQYSRATYNGNMRGVVVHYYVWKNEIWQTLRLDERGWHAADGKTRRAGRRPGQRIGGNLDTIAIEAIGPSKETEATTALLCAWLCREFGLDPALDIWQHWDFSGKNCPLYIRPHWGEFLTAVKGHMGVAPVPPKPAPSGSFQKGDAIVLNGPVFRDSYGTGQGSTFSNHESTITIVAPTTRFAPYHVGEIGWAKEKDLTKKEA